MESHKNPQEIEKELEYLENVKIVNDNTILRVVAGSHAYGTNLPTSDYDERGIFIDIPERVCLPFDKLQQLSLPEDDIVIYELSKYVSLLSEQNPSIMEIIWVEDQDVKFVSEAGRVLLENRHKFLSKEVANTYIGFAEAQEKRLKGHNTWIKKPQPVEAPQQKDFVSILYNLETKNSVSKASELAHEQFKAIKLKDGLVALYSFERLPNLPEGAKGWMDRLGNPIYNTPLEILTWADAGHETPKPDVLVKLNKEVWEKAKRNHKDYWDWKANRNEARSELEVKFGYDTKHAMHLIRLLRSGLDILEKGYVPVRREDAKELLEIRNGKLSYDELIAETEILKKKIKEAAIHSKLPDRVDDGLIKSITFEIYRKHWLEKGVFNEPSSRLKLKK